MLWSVQLKKVGNVKKYFKGKGYIKTKHFNIRNVDVKSTFVFYRIVL